MSIAFHRCDTGVTTAEIELDEKIHAYQVSFKGSGTATIEVWPHEQTDDEDHSKTASIGWSPVQDGTDIDISTGTSIPVLICGANDKLRITAGSAIDYSVTGVK